MIALAAMGVQSCSRPLASVGADWIRVVDSFLANAGFAAAVVSARWQKGDATVKKRLKAAYDRDAKEGVIT